MAIRVVPLGHSRPAVGRSLRSAEAGAVPSARPQRILGGGGDLPPIFVSYRWTDTEHATRAIVEGLRASFGAGSVFHDVTNVRVGSIDATITAALREAHVVVPIIGPRWVQLLHEKLRTGRKDRVRLEVAFALDHGIPIVPAFVSGAAPPTPDELPSDLLELEDAAGVAISNDYWEVGLRRLIERVAEAMGAATPPGVPHASPAAAATARADAPVAAEGIHRAWLKLSHAGIIGAGENVVAICEATMALSRPQGGSAPITLVATDFRLITPFPIVPGPGAPSFHQLPYSDITDVDYKRASRLDKHSPRLTVTFREHGRKLTMKLWSLSPPDAANALGQYVKSRV